MEFKNVKAEDLRQKPIDQLLGVRKEWRKSLVEERMSPLSGISGQAKIKQLRTAIARLETVMTEARKNLGKSTAKKAVAKKKK